MKSKDRVLKAINHQITDRVPVNFVGANDDIDKRLKKHFGLAENDNYGLLEALKVDFRVINIPYRGPVLHESVQDRHVDPLWGIRRRWIKNEHGGYWDFCDFPLE